jgi:hypothetical protein
MKRSIVIPFALASLALAAPAFADDLTNADRFLCSAATVAACCDDGQCASGTPNELNVPQFIEVDVKGRSISSTKASGRERKSVVDNLRRENGQILLQGMENHRAYSILIDEKSGEMAASVASAGCGINVFGACTPLSSR